VIAANAPLAVQASKRVASGRYAGADSALPRDLPYERDAWQANDEEIVALMSTEDAIEGPTAFAEKREPVWTAR
jgi:crotonobetainyl-CoA hydratase